MKSFKYLVFILVIFLKTGNVLSESTLFNVNNVEISGNLTANNQFFVNEAIKKGFNEMMNRVLLDKDVNKLKNLSLDKINNLVSYYQIIETAEDRVSSKLIKKYNIFFDKEKVHNLFYNFEISYSDINQYEIYFLPIHKKNNQLYVTNQRDDSISIIDMNKKKRISTLSNICEYPEGIDISYSENLIVVACWFEDSIILLDLESYKFVKKIEVSGGPRSFGNFILEDYE